MPIFKFHCSSCGLRFEAMRGGDVGAPKHQPCRRCGKPAEKLLSASNFKFAHRPDAPRPQNTGASSVDHDVDVIIGRSAQANLREFQARQDYKQRVIAAEKVSGDYLSRLDDGDYFVMTEDERVSAKKARLLNQDAMRRITEFRKKNRAYGYHADRVLDGIHEIPDESSDVGRQATSTEAASQESSR